MLVSYNQNYQNHLTNKFLAFMEMINITTIKMNKIFFQNNNLCLICIKMIKMKEQFKMLLLINSHHSKITYYLIIIKKILMTISTMTKTMDNIIHLINSKMTIFDQSTYLILYSLKDYCFFFLTLPNYQYYYYDDKNMSY